MIAELKKLTAAEADFLLKAPVIYSVYALSSFKNISKAGKKDAVKLAHIKTYTERYQLIPFYEEAEKNFEQHFEAYLDAFYPFDSTQCLAIKKDMDKVNALINKLDEQYAGQLRKSLEGYARHVKSAAHTFFQDIIFPIAFSKL